MLNQNRPLLIGITGGIGSGKSTVCRVFNCLGVPVYDADSRARWLMNNNKDLILKIRNEFGEASYKEGVLDRTYIAKLVFSDPEKLATINSLSHPIVALDFEDWVSKHLAYPYLIKEAALLIESDAYKQLDKLVLVIADENTRIARVLKRDPQRSKEEVMDIIKRQSSDYDKINHVHYVVYNNIDTTVLLKILELNQLFYQKK
jgi:dephospho-CoA kinase